MTVPDLAINFAFTRHDVLSLGFYWDQNPNWIGNYFESMCTYGGENSSLGFSKWMVGMFKYLSNASNIDMLNISLLCLPCWLE